MQTIRGTGTEKEARGRGGRGRPRPWGRAAALCALAALALAGCGDDDGSSCTRIADVPNGASCIAIVNELTCGRSSCGGIFPDVASADECQAMADAAGCAQDDYDADDDSCQVAGCLCNGFQAEQATCTLGGCRTCGDLCGYVLTDVPDVVACAANAVDLNCVTTIAYDADTQVCTLSGCQICRAL
jgi:hypothetical protein